VKIVAKSILDGDLVAGDLLHLQVSRLRKPLFFLKALWVPKGIFAPFLNFVRLLVRSHLGTQDERGCFNELFGHLCLGLGGAGMRQVRDVHGLTRWIVVLLHDLDHLIAILVHFNKGKVDPSFRKLAHLVLELKTIWETFRVIITKLRDV